MSHTRTADIQSRFDFTNSVLELEDAGFNSMGFTIEYDEICCLECGKYHEASSMFVAGMIRYESAVGEGHVFPLRCPTCRAKGLLFAGPELRAGGSGDLVRVLEARVRNGQRRPSR